MGRWSSHCKNAAILDGKNAAILDSDDTDSMSSSSTAQSDTLVSNSEEVLFDKETVLDQWLDALYEKRGSTREKALASIAEAFNSSLQHEFVEKKSATLLHQCLNSIKKGSSKEITLASRVIGLLALTTGPGEKAPEILEESVFPISEALGSRSDSSKISSLLECLAIITFIGGEESEATEKSMQVMWQVIHPKFGPNVAAVKPSPTVITAVLSAWSFLLTTMDGQTFNLKSWHESISYLLTLLDKDERGVRIAAGEALALIFEVGGYDKFCGEIKVSGESSTDEGNKSRELVHIQALRSKVLNQVRILSIEAGGKGSTKKDLSNQRNTFRDIQEFLEYGYSPRTSTKVVGESLTTTTWAELIQLNFLKHFLGGGFVKHMQESEFLHDFFGFTPKKKSHSVASVAERRNAEIEKRIYKSPNSVLNKARTRFINKQRILSQDMKGGYYTCLITAV